MAGIDGAGLGLAIVKSIVDLHGGTVGATPTTRRRVDVLVRAAADAAGDVRRAAPVNQTS